MFLVFFFFQAEDGIRYLVRSRGLGDVYKRQVFGIVPVGSYLTIFGFAMVYLLAVLGIGLLVSTFADTQQQATLISFFFMMIFILPVSYTHLTLPTSDLV